MVGDGLAADIALVVVVGVLVVGDGLAADIALVVVVGVLVVGDGLAADIADVILVSVLVVGDNLAAGITDVITVFIGMRQRFGMAGAAGAGAGVGTVAVGCPRTPVVVVGVNSTIGLATGRTDSLCCAGSRAAGAGVDNIFTDLQLLAAVIEDLLAGVREEIAAVIRVIGVGKYHGVVRVFGGYADECAGGHGPADGQRLAGGQIHIVGLVRNRIVLDNGGAADFQGALVDVNRTAVFPRRVAFNRPAGKCAARRITVAEHAAALLRCSVLRKRSARHSHRRIIGQINRTAPLGFVSGESCAAERECTFLADVDTAAIVCGTIP